MSEILGVLFKYLLALIAIVAVVAVLYEALGSSNASESVSEISQIQANVYQLYSATPDSTTQITQGSLAAVIAAGVLPTSMISGTTANDPWGNAVAVPTVTTPAVLGLAFTSVPMSSCAKIVASALQAGVSVGIGAAGSPTTTLAAYPSTGNFGPTAATVCATQTTANVSITFAFYPSSSVSNNTTKSTASSS